jgi:hypothetical protein
MFSRSESRFLKLKFLIPLAIIFVIIALRIIIPIVLLKKSNEFLTTFSPIHYYHINTLTISFLPIHCSLQGIRAKVKSTNQQFLTADSVDASIAWREIIKGRFLSDVSIINLDLLLINENNFLASLKKEILQMKIKTGKVKIEKIEKIELKRASLTFENYKSQADGSNLRISDINGSITNFTPTKKHPLSYFNLKAILVDQKSELKIVGEANKLKVPADWNLDAEVKDLELTALNPYFKNHSQLTFTKGSLDIYSEARSENGKTEGYIKTFFKGINIIPNKEKSTKAKHLGIEFSPVLIDLILHQSKNKSFATNIDFEYDKKIKIKTIPKTKRTGKKGRAEGQLKPGIDDRYKLTNF